MLNPLTLSRRVALVLGGASVFALAGTAWAAPPMLSASQRAGIEAQYKQQVANCNSGRTDEGRATCLKEAGAARQQALQGDLSEGDQNYSQNALDRCKLLPAGQQATCMDLMQHPTQTQGSVGGGGVLREYEYQVPAAQ